VNRTEVHRRGWKRFKNSDSTLQSRKFSSSVKQLLLTPGFVVGHDGEVEERMVHTTDWKPLSIDLCIVLWERDVSTIV